MSSLSTCVNGTTSLKWICCHLRLWGAGSVRVHEADLDCLLTGRIDPDPLSGYLGGCGEPCRGPERPTWIILTIFTICLFVLQTHKQAFTQTDRFGLSQPNEPYSVEGSSGASAVACGVRCGRREVGQSGRRWRCRGWTAGRRWWAWLEDCCGAALAGRDCEGSDHTVPAERGRPGG